MNEKAKRRETRTLLAVIALFVAFAMTPQFDNQVFSQDKTPEYIGPEQLGVDVNTPSAKVVKFGGKSWCVIGYDGNGVASGSGEVVLLMKDSLQSSPYSTRNKPETDYYDDPTYKGSTLQILLDAYVNENFTDGEKQTVIPRELAAMDVDAYDYDWWDANFQAVDEVPYEGVTASAWPLSAKEATDLNADIRKINESYWLRSLSTVPGPDWDEGEYDTGYLMSIVWPDGGVKSQHWEEYLTDSKGVRPAIKLKKDNILYITPAGSGEWKLTLKDEAHKNFSVNTCDNTLDSNGDLVIKYQNAVPGDNEHISYLIVGEDGSVDTYKQCDKVTAVSGTATLTGLPKDSEGKISLSEGDKLYVFNEQDNEYNANLASNLIELGTTTGHDWGFTAFGWGYRPGSGEHYAWASYNCKRDSSHWKSIDAKVESSDTTPKCDEIVIPKYTASVTAEEAPDGVARERIFRDDPIDPIGHNWQFDNFEWTGSEEDGYTAATGKYTCLNDSSHKNQAEAEITQEVTVPNCTTAGKTTYTASISYFDSPDEKNHKETKDAKHIKALGHSWDNGKVTKKATITEDGEKIYTCTVCGETKKQIIPKLNNILLAKMTAKGKKGFTIGWTKVTGAAGYDIFLAQCNAKGKKSTLKKVKTVKGNKTFKWKKTGLKKKTSYKAYVKAYVIKNGKKTYVKTSPLIHAYTSNSKGRYTNARRVTVNKTNVTLKQGKTFKIKAKVKKAKKNKKLMPKKHVAKLRYLTSNSKIAAVSKSGKITARGKGTCYIYAYAHNGVSKKINITVR